MQRRLIEMSPQLSWQIPELLFSCDYITYISIQAHLEGLCPRGHPTARNLLWKLPCSLSATSAGQDH